MSFPPSNAEARSKDTDAGGKALAGFLLSGFLLALLGAILPAWGYHRDPPDFTAVGNYFLSVAVGVVCGGGLMPGGSWRGAAWLSCWCLPACFPV